MNFQEFYLNNIAYLIDGGWLAVSLDSIADTLFYLGIAVFVLCIPALLMICLWEDVEDITKKKIIKIWFIVILISLATILTSKITDTCKNYLINKTGITLRKQVVSSVSKVNTNEVITLFNNYIHLVNKELMEELKDKESPTPNKEAGEDHD